MSQNSKVFYEEAQRFYGQLQKGGFKDQSGPLYLAEHAFANMERAYQELEKENKFLKAKVRSEQ